MAWLKSGDRAADIYIDLGTANTLVVARGRGILINEPSVIAYRERDSGQRSVIAVGAEAKAKLGRTPSNIVACYPMKDGVIADLDVTETMLRHFMSRVKRPMSFTKPRVVISLPYAANDVDKKAVTQAALSAGAGEITLIDETMAAAVGAGLPIHEPKGNMVIDIGGGTSEIAVISLYGIVHCEAIAVGGHAFDQAIVRHVKRTHNLIIGEQTAERIKIQIGSAMPNDKDTKAQIRGVDFVTNLPRSIDISASEVNEAINDLLSQIVEAGRRTLEKAPPDLVPDLIRDGVVVTGGGGLLKQLDVFLEQQLGIPVRIADDPLTALARGGDIAIQNSTLLKRIMMQ
jgi:rod shape-determining protein MreB